MSEGSIYHCQPQVAAYLCADPAIFVTAEYYLAFGDKEAKGDRIFDLLAWDARAKRYFIVEVTTNRSLPKRLADRIALDWSRRDLIARSLAKKGIELDPGGLWWWVFIRGQFLEAFRALVPNEQLPYLRTTAIDCTHFYPDYRDARRRGEEPPDASGAQQMHQKGT